MTDSAAREEGGAGPTRPRSEPKLSYQRASTTRLLGSDDQSTLAANSSVRGNSDRSAPTVLLVAGSYWYTPTMLALTPVVWRGGSKWTNWTRPRARMTVPTVPATGGGP